MPLITVLCNGSSLFTSNDTSRPTNATKNMDHHVDNDVRSNKFPYALEAVSITFQISNSPSGNMQEYKLCFLKAQAVGVKSRNHR